MFPNIVLSFTEKKQLKTAISLQKRIFENKLQNLALCINL